MNKNITTYLRVILISVLRPKLDIFKTMRNCLVIVFVPLSQQLITTAQIIYDLMKAIK